MKSYPDSFLKLILKLLNKIKDENNFPQKMGNRNDISFTNYYRPITVSITITKLLTSILNERILKWVLDNKILHQEQIEFQKNSRPSDHLFVLKTLIDCYKNAGKKLYTCFIDFQKAFDNTWRMGLFYKLISYNLNLNTINTMTCIKILDNP